MRFNERDDRAVPQAEGEVGVDGREDLVEDVGSATRQRVQRRYSTGFTASISV